jgi:hypothetical protein
MNKVQYYHGKEEGYTAAVDVDFEADDLLYLLKTGQPLFIKVGFSCLHPNDNYEKAVGRSVSSNNMEETELKLLQVVDHLDGEHLLFYFRGGSITIHFRTSRKSKKPHMIYACDYDRLIH